MRQWHKIVWTLPLFFILAAARAADCNAELKLHLQTDLDLPYQEFDQTLGKGMRSLASLGCAKETADLILVYMQKNNNFTRSLTWHVAQQRALQGDNVVAAQYAKMALLPQEDFSSNPLRWNDFVFATIAFLEKDLSRFKSHRNKVAEGKAEFFGNALNLKLLDKLLLNFDLGYKDAAGEN